MLVGKLEKGTVIGLRLISGEEILATFESYDKQNAVYLVKKPLTLASDGNGQIGLVPASMMADDSHSLEYNAAVVVSKFVPKAGFLETYKQSVSDVIAPTQKIIT